MKVLLLSKNLALTDTLRTRIGTATISELIDYEKQRLWLGSQRAQTINVAREKSRNGHIKRLEGSGISARPTFAPSETRSRRYRTC